MAILIQYLFISGQHTHMILYIILFYSMIKFIFRFSQQIAKDIAVRKRFLQFNKQELLGAINSKHEFTINQIILISAALKKHGLQHQPSIQLIERNLFHYPAIYYGTYLETKQKVPRKYIDYYINHFYKFNQDIDEELAMARLLAQTCKFEYDSYNQEILDECRLRNKQKLLSLFDARNLDLSQLIEFMRMFKHIVDRETLQNYIDEIFEPLPTNQDTILFLYLTKDLKLKHKLEVPTETKDPKSLCLLCQIIKQDKTLIENITSKIDWRIWDYYYIVWISEFLSEQSLRQAHKQILTTRISDLNTLMVYLKYLPKDLHKSVNDWLCKHHLFDQFQTDELLNILQYVDPQYFDEYLKKIMKECRGKYEWQHMNCIYYYALKWNIHNEHTDTIRIYVVNGYMSLGTSRNRIPGNSYFYRLLELLSPEELYQFKIDFGYQ